MTVALAFSSSTASSSTTWTTDTTTFASSTNLPIISHPHRGSNRLFLDTADTAVWQELLPLGIFHGVTTNPTLLERANEPCTVDNLHKLAHLALQTINENNNNNNNNGDGDFFYCQEFMCQAWGTTAKEMYDIGMALSQPDRQRIVIKVPVTVPGTQAAARLIRSGVRVCLTACYHSHQAIVAAGLGAEYIAPYLGRMTDNHKDGLQECMQMEQMVRGGMKSSTRILVASIRSVESMAECMAMGQMDTFTFSPDVARALFAEPLTIQAAEEFEQAAQRGGVPES